MASTTGKNPTLIAAELLMFWTSATDSRRSRSENQQDGGELRLWLERLLNSSYDLRHPPSLKLFGRPLKNGTAHENKFDRRAFRGSS